MKLKKTMGRFFLLLLLCGSFAGFSQSKRICFLDENDVCITKQTYRKGENDFSEFLRVSYETDNALVSGHLWRPFQAAGVEGVGSPFRPGGNSKKIAGLK